MARAKKKAASAKRARTTSSSKRKTARKAAPARGNGFAPRVRAAPTDEVQAIYVVGLRNAHAVEKEALEVMQRQVDRIRNYPDVAQRLRSHIKETEQQVKRLDEILERHQESSSMLKDLVTQVIGNSAAVVHSVAGDEILKNAFANQALEAYEIAAYKSLITMALRQDDRKAIPLLKRTLAEEERMAKWVDANVAKLTVAYLDREVAGKKADR
jgi:ferritin-like metal-binding protein YciE